MNSNNESSAVATSSLNVHDAAVSVRVPSPDQLDPSPPALEKWCYTNTKVSKVTFRWIIDKFSYCPEAMRQALESPEFSGPDEKLKWRLRVYPRGVNRRAGDCVSIYLLLVAPNNEKVMAQFKFSLLNFRGEKDRAKEIHGVAYEFKVNGRDWGFNKFIERNELFEEANGLLPDDKLTIFCEVSVISDRVNTVGQSSTTGIEVPQCSLSEDMATLLEDEKHTDFVFEVGTQEFRAHKAILAARSKYFAAMFQHDTTDPINSIVMKGVDESAFKEMLRFIYTGKVESLSTMATKLLVGAHKYELNRLKAMCEEALSSHSLNVESAADILVLADKCHADQLKQRTLQFMSTHVAQVTETSSWAELVKSHPSLVTEAYRASALQHSPSSPSVEKRLKLN